MVHFRFGKRVPLSPTATPRNASRASSFEQGLADIEDGKLLVFETELQESRRIRKHDLAKLSTGMSCVAD